MNYISSYTLYLNIIEEVFSTWEKKTEIERKN